jgi:hypothetical protein
MNAPDDDTQEQLDILRRTGFKALLSSVQDRKATMGNWRLNTSYIRRELGLTVGDFQAMTEKAKWCLTGHDD